MVITLQSILLSSLTLAGLNFLKICCSNASWVSGVGKSFVQYFLVMEFPSSSRITIPRITLISSVYYTIAQIPAIPYRHTSITDIRQNNLLFLGERCRMTKKEQNSEFIHSTNKLELVNETLARSEYNRERATEGSFPKSRLQSRRAFESIVHLYGDHRQNALTP